MLRGDILDIRTKNKLENILAPIAINISPNIITFLSIVLMLIACYFIIIKLLIPAAIFFALSALFDALDGVVAKKYNRSTRFGAFFDRIADKTNDSLIIIAITYVGYIKIELGLITLFLILLASYISATIEVITKTRIGEVLSQRPIRSLLIFLGLLIGTINTIYIEYTIIIVLLIAIFSLSHRFYVAAKLLGGKK